MFGWSQSSRRQRLLEQPFPPQWDEFLTRNVAHYQLLDEAEQNRLCDDTQVLVAEKSWEGCGGIRVTEEMKVTIAGQAALMLLGMRHDYFQRVRTILLYPSTFVPQEEDVLDRGKTIPSDGPAVGQASSLGPVVLAWDSVLAEGRNPSAGRNVVVHEFAHQLDFADGFLGGTVALEGPEGARWRELLFEEYHRLRWDLRRGHETFFGDYAAKDLTEFFAVASERFFTLPALMRSLHPGLYAAMAGFYGVEPVRWFTDS